MILQHCFIIATFRITKYVIHATGKMRSGSGRCVVTLAAIAAIGLGGSFSSTLRMMTSTQQSKTTIATTHTTKEILAETNCNTTYTTTTAAIDRRCFPWTVDTDRWWTHHPEYEVSLQNETHFCYSRIENRGRKPGQLCARFVRIAVEGRLLQ